MASKEKNNFDIKITDFGMSCFFDPDQGVNLTLGSPFYMAPEVLKKEIYNEKCDIYSLGVLTYSMLSGDFPFKAENLKDMQNMVSN